MSDGAPVFDLRRERLNRGLSPRQLGAACGVGGNTIRRVEDGHIPSPAIAKRIADFFGVQVTDLIPLEEAA